METLNPIWAELNWEVHCKLTDKASFDVWDWDRIGGHDFEGRVEFDLNHYMPFPIQVIEITKRLLPRVKDGKVKESENISGTITIELGFDSIEQKMLQSSTAAQAAGHSKQALGRHFGRPLEESLRAANEAMELHLVDKSIAFIRSKAIKTQGVFRLPGNATKMAEVRALIDKGDDVDLDNEDEYDIPSLLKMYFRELPDTLIPAACFPEFLAAANLDDRKKRIAHFARIFRDSTLVPVVNRDVFIDLVHLMDEIASHEEVNKMTHRNLATCLAPTIIIPNGIQKASPVEVLTQTKTVTDLLEFVIINHESIFKSILSDGGVERRKSARELTQQRVEKRSGGEDKSKKDREKKSSSSSSGRSHLSSSSKSHDDKDSEKDKEKLSPRDRSSSVSKKSEHDGALSPRGSKDKEKEKSKLRESGSKTPRGDKDKDKESRTRDSRSPSVKSPRPPKIPLEEGAGILAHDLTMAIFDTAPSTAAPPVAPRRGLKRTNNSGAVVVTPAAPAKPAAEAAAAVVEPAHPLPAEPSGEESGEESLDEDDEIERLERELREAELKEAELLRGAEIKERTGKNEPKETTEKPDDMEDDEIDKLLMEEEALQESDEDEEAAEAVATSPQQTSAVADDDDGFNPDDVDMD